jgi:hypothetical protein
MTDIVEAPVAVKDLKTLANEIRIAHAAAGNTAQNFLEHILTAGDGLIEARKQVKHGEWGAWLKRECALPERDLSERTAQAYMQIARGRAALEANPQRAADLSLRGALRLLQPPKPSPRRTPSRSSRSKANQRRFGRHDALGWWQQAPLEERRKFIDSIGLRGGRWTDPAVDPPGDPVPPEFIEAARNPKWTTSAFGDHFERLITQHVMAPRYGWPMVPVERRRCTQAASLALALPAKLGSVARVLKLAHQKDDGGRRAMMQMAQPRRPRKDEDPSGVYWFDDPERREQLYAYCKNDVAVERALHHRIEGLIPDEQALWTLDSVINDRGIYTDGKLLDAAIKIAEAAFDSINNELQATTEGAVDTVHQTAKLIRWLTEHACTVTDIQKGTIKHALRRKNLSPAVRRVIELRLDGAHAAAAKLLTMRDWRNGDGRARGVFRFHGASTGRWTSFGIQLQNLKRPEVEDMGAAIAAISTGSLEHLKQHYPQPMSVVGDITRALICAAPGHRLIIADFSGIESRVTAWISGQQSKIDQWAKFDRTGDPKDEPYYILGRALGFKTIMRAPAARLRILLSATWAAPARGKSSRPMTTRRPRLRSSSGSGLGAGHIRARWRSGARSTGRRSKPSASPTV